MLGILDIGIGNIQSVWNAVFSEGYDPVRITGSDECTSSITHLILPGVGMFLTASKRLHDSGIIEPVRSFVASGKPLLGICLGMQLLADYGTEGAESPGLGVIPGVVDKLEIDLRLPHVGWNSVHWKAKHPILSDIKDDRDFFVGLL